jgi:hypothetical protein
MYFDCCRKVSSEIKTVCVFSRILDATDVVSSFSDAVDLLAFEYLPSSRVSLLRTVLGFEVEIMKRKGGKHHQHLPEMILSQLPRACLLLFTMGLPSVS